MNIKLKVAIVKSGQKSYQVAQALHWHPSKLSHIVIGTYLPSQDEKESLAEVLQVDQNDLFPSDPVRRNG